MSAGEATDAAKRKFAHEHPDWVDGHPPPKPPQKHHAAPTTQTHHYVVNVCNLIGLEAVCEHNGRKAVKEVEASQATGRAMKESTEAKADAGKQEGTFVLAVVPKAHAELHLKPDFSTPIHNQTSVGDQTIDPSHSTDRHRITEDATREAKEEKDIEREQKALHSEDARLKAHGARLEGQRAQIEARARELDKKQADLHQRAASKPANGNLGHKKAQQIHQQRQQLQRDRDAQARTKARNAQSIADHQHKQDESANAAQRFHKENAPRARFNFRLYTERGDPTLVDVVKLEAKMSSHCSAHPVWKVYEAQTHKLLAAHNGMTLDCNHLMPPVVDETVLTRIVPHLPQQPEAYWLRNIHPQIYKIELQTCHAAKVVLIHVYPQIKSGFAITVHRDNGHLAAPDDSWLGRIEKYEKKFKQMLNILQAYAPKIENLEVSILAQGALNLSNTWEEEEHGAEVVWKASVDADMDLIEVDFRIPIADINPLPKFIKEKIGANFDIELFFTFDGKVGAKFAGFWTNRKGEGFHLENGGVQGSLAFGIGGQIYVGKNGSWGQIEALGTSPIGVGAEIHAKEDAFLLGLFFQFVHPFEVEFKITIHGFEMKDWKEDAWRPGPKHYLPELHVFGGEKESG